jgi:hypothetical protein
MSTHGFIRLVKLAADYQTQIRRLYIKLNVSVDEKKKPRSARSAAEYTAERAQRDVALRTAQ